MSAFKYSSFGPYFQAYLKQLPGKGRGELSKIARHLGVSTTLVSQICAGKKSFTSEQTIHLVRYLALSPLEGDYVMALVQLDRAGNRELQNYWKAKIDEIKRQALKVANRVQVDRQLTDAERTTFYSSPIYAAISLYSSTSERGKTRDEIAARFDLSRARASKIIQFLLETGLCKEVDGRIQMGIQKTHAEQGSPHLLRHLTNWRLKAVHQGEELTEQELMYSAPVSLSRSDFEDLREQMVQFIQKFLKQVHASPADEIACFNLDFFWIKK